MMQQFRKHLPFFAPFGRKGSESALRRSSWKGGGSFHHHYHHFPPESRARGAVRISYIWLIQRGELLGCRFGIVWFRVRMASQPLSWKRKKKVHVRLFLRIVWRGFATERYSNFGGILLKENECCFLEDLLHWVFLGNLFYTCACYWTFTFLR